MEKGFLLVVEDDPAVQRLLSLTLETQGYDFCLAASGHEALSKAVCQTPDVLLLDLGLPDMDGLTVIEKIRAWSSLPILILSARSEEQEKIRALDAGADDYITKPFSVEELLARIRAAIRRAALLHQSAEAPEASVFINGDLRLDYAAGRVFFRGEELHLTPREYKLLCLLAKNAGKVLTHAFILREVWGSSLPSDVASLRVFMVGLRKKFESGADAQPYIQTHVGIGYQLIRYDATDQ